MRRQFIALVCLGLLVFLAGCSAPGSIDMTAADDDQLVDEATRNASDWLDEDSPHRGMLLEAIEEGESSVTSYMTPPVEEGKPFYHNGSYYELEYTVTDTHQETMFGLEVTPNATDESRERIPYEELPEVDRKALAPLFPVPEGTELDNVGIARPYNTSEQIESVLLNNNTVVVYEGTEYPISVTHEEPVEVRDYRYTATQVADSDAELRQYLKDEYAFTLTGLSQAERDIVREAIDDSYYAENSNNGAFRDVLRRFHEHESLMQNSYRGEWLVRYNGELYWAELRYSGYEEFGED